MARPALLPLQLLLLLMATGATTAAARRQQPQPLPPTRLRADGSDVRLRLPHADFAVASAAPLFEWAPQHAAAAARPVALSPPEAAAGMNVLWTAATPVNAQLYPCNASAPWTSRQQWTFAAPGPAAIALASGGGSLQLQLPSPNLATTCPVQLNASCWNLVVGPATSALQFALADTKLTVAGGAAAVRGLCVADSNGAGSASHSNGYLANVFLTECELAGNWTHFPADGTVRAAGQSGRQCLDVGSAGSSSDLGFAFDLLPAAPPERQAYHSDKFVSWGGSVIQADEDYHMFAAVFSGGKGLSSWQSNSAIMHLQASAPEGPFKPTQDGPKKDGIVVGAEAHNPTVVRANDGTFLLFSIGHSPLVASKNVSGPWSPVKFTACNNPAPLVIPGRDEVYVYCHGGPDQGHWGSSVGMTWTPHWSSGVWHTAANNTDDIHGGGRDLFGHPVEDPFAWYAPSTNSLAPGSFHLLCHGFRMGMVNNSDDSPSRVGNAYGAYANAPTPFGPWSFQEARVAYSGHVRLENGASLGSLQRRERPHLLLSAAGVPTHLYNGVCPADGYSQGASNSSGHCYTFVQKIKPGSIKTDESRVDDRYVGSWATPTSAEVSHSIPVGRPVPPNGSFVGNGDVSLVYSAGNRSATPSEPGIDGSDTNNEQTKPGSVMRTDYDVRASATSFSAMDPNVQLTNGRFATNVTEGSVRCDWTGATIALKVTSTTSVALNLTGASQWTVVVDGAVSRVVQSAAPQPQPVVLASGLSKTGTHTVAAVKMAEALCGAATLSGVTLDAGGKLLPPASAPTRRLVFLGDSITCGYGSLGQAPCPGYSCGAPTDAPKKHANWESGYASYGALLGRQFVADTQIVCVSGAGFAHEWNKPGVAPTEGGMTEKFGQVLGSGGMQSSNSIDTSWVPDAIVVNIGTNDVGIPHGNASAVWVETYVTFLRKWRAVWPDTHFLLGCFPMTEDATMHPALDLVAAAFSDSKTTVLSFPSLHSFYGKGCYGHPSMSGHSAMANLTGPVLAKTLGWKLDVERAIALPKLKTDESSSTVDVAVYGSSGAACVAAIAAARSGAGSVLLLSQTGHIGGMLTGGLMHTDAANADVIQGITREFFLRTAAYYEGMGVPANATRGGPGDSWLFESHVGERVLEEMLDEVRATVVRSVGGVVAVTRSGTRVERVVFESGAPAYHAVVWVDASYEGAILERVATMVWGREGQDQYNETSAGRREFEPITGATHHGRPIPHTSPYWDASAEPYDTPSNIIPHVAPQRPAAVGGGDLWMEPYDFRLCFTNSPEFGMPFTKPASYNSSEWEFWRRVYKNESPSTLAQAGLNCVSHIPNNYSDCGQKACVKCDMLGMNHGTDNTDGSWGYPNGTNEQRKAIWRAHVEFTRGLLWFWMSDPAVPKAVREDIAQYGHCTDEYDADSDPPHWPHQLYIREAKRLVGDFVWSEWLPDATRRNRSVGLGSYNFDSHFVSRAIQRTGNAGTDSVVKEGRVKVNEQQTAGGSSPTPSGVAGLSYGCAEFGAGTSSRCVAGMPGGAVVKNGSDATCGGMCSPLAPFEWLAVRRLSTYSPDNRTLIVSLPEGQASSWLKKSKQLARTLPAALKLAVAQGQHIPLRAAAVELDDTYDLVSLAGEATGSESPTCGVCMKTPFTMPFDTMLPKRSEVSNVLAPVAISATHVRYNAVRMEPTWMILGHAAGAAAALAAKQRLPSVQAVDVDELQRVLVEQKQLLTWPPALLEEGDDPAGDAGGV
jgi:lysophospholipase L1-like esterase